jgi:hypothetical protein
MHESTKLTLRKKDKIEMSDLLILKSLSLSILLARKEDYYIFQNSILLRIEIMHHITQRYKIYYVHRELVIGVVKLT